MSRSSIFISYRRDDAPYAVGRIFDQLVAKFGNHAVFRDVDAIPVGSDFGAHIRERLEHCKVVLAIIGPRWMDAGSVEGVRRLDDARDWVRQELEAARKAGIRVFPVLLSEATILRREDLPSSLSWLADLHAAPVRRDPDFHQDLAKLINALRSDAIGISPMPQDVSGVWQAVRETEDVDEHRRFIETFDRTPEALEARRRIDQLSTLKRLRLIGAYIEHGALEDDAAGWLLIEGVGVFKRCWANTPWDKELANLRKFATENVDEEMLFYSEQAVGPDDDLLAASLEDWNNRADKFLARPE